MSTSSCVLYANSSGCSVFHIDTKEIGGRHMRPSTVMVARRSVAIIRVTASTLAFTPGGGESCHGAKGSVIFCGILTSFQSAIRNANILPPVGSWFDPRANGSLCLDGAALKKARALPFGSPSNERTSKRPLNAASITGLRVRAIYSCCLIKSNLAKLRRCTGVVATKIVTISDRVNSNTRTSPLLWIGLVSPLPITEVRWCFSKE